MNKILKLLIPLPFFIIGCSPNVIEENKLIQKIENFHMNIFSKGGEKIYSITSPNSKFNKIKLEINLKSTTINIFEGTVLK